MLMILSAPVLPGPILRILLAPVSLTWSYAEDPLSPSITWSYAEDPLSPSISWSYAEDPLSSSQLQ